ncbi:mixed-linked glucanase precursor MLG1 [Fusarium beomiforme]|uniref:Mixed-linked glucanase MLG1 n=1 Tax=Fusarium beomiforme TaxID=44412 RepID=A0A9P5AQX0_9HYPO|nr:mixed-linked glucanase precursor MLG1 [Fusarium beomiforme]
MAYSLTTSFLGESLISGFEWFNGRDLSNGYVQYQDLAGANEYGLYSVDPFSGTVRLRPDSARRFGLDQGRPSIRLESKDSYQYGLFIADFQHMPISQCGTWPAFWAYGANWPNNGEVDILEGANLAYTNIMSAHTAEGCMLDPADSNLFSGDRRSLDCAVGTDNVGCGFTPPASDTSSYGDGFNAVGGGVYAMEWDSDYISIWHFPRGAIPADIEAKRPDPRKWGLPQSLFGGSKCNVDEYFNNMRIVLNINFCGDYGEGTWRDSETCRALAPTCREYVANNPLDFQDAYFDVSYIDVYARLGGDIPPVVPSSTSEAPTEISIPSASTPGPNTPVSGNTRFPNSTSIVTRPTPKEESSETEEPMTTTTLTGISSVVVTIPGSGTNSPTVSSLPVATGGSSVNPAKIGDYAYLGCFGSQTGFQTFNEKTESDDMTIEKCIDACKGLTYVGIFEGICYCASKLDADTRALRNESSCNRPCPGDNEQFCGGMVSQRSRRSIPLRRDAPSNVLLTVYADIADAGQPDVPPAMGPEVNGTAVVSDVTGGPSSPAAESGQDGSTASDGQGGGSAQQTANGQAGSSDDLPANDSQVSDIPAATNIRVAVDTATVTAVAALTDANADPVVVAFSTLSGGQVLEATQALLETGRTVFTSTITFFTVLPTDPGSLVPQESIVTMSYSLCDYCDTPTWIPPPMTTQVINCDGCGTNGENIATLTVPIHINVTVAGTNATQATGNKAAAGVVPDQTREIPPIVPTGMGRNADNGPEVTTIVITYLTTQLVTYGTQTNSVSTATRTMRRTVVVTVSDTETLSILPIPSPGRPNTPTFQATPTPSAPSEPAVVSAASSKIDDFFVYFAIVALAILALSL